ncbi:unnamed protein product [Lampetra planeri]
MSTARQRSRRLAEWARARARQGRDGEEISFKLEFVLHDVRAVCSLKIYTGASITFNVRALLAMSLYELPVRQTQRRSLLLDVKNGRAEGLPGKVAGQARQHLKAARYNTTMPKWPHVKWKAMEEVEEEETKVAEAMRAGLLHQYALEEKEATRSCETWGSASDIVAEFEAAVEAMAQLGTVERHMRTVEDMLDRLNMDGDSFSRDLLFKLLEAESEREREREGTERH